MVSNPKAKRMASYLAAILKDVEADPKPTVAQLAKKYGCHRTAITRLLKRQGITLGDQRGILKHDAIYAKIKADLDADETLSYAALAQRYGINTSLVSHAMRRFYGMEPRRARKITTTDVARMRQMYAAGNSIPRISQVVGVSVGCISRHLNKERVTQQRKAEYAQRAQQAYEAVLAEGISAVEAAARFNLTVGRVYGYIERMQRQEKENASTVDDGREHSDRGIRATEGAGRGSADHDPLGRPNDLRDAQGRQDHGGLGDADAAEGQAPRQRLRRLG